MYDCHFWPFLTRAEQRMGNSDINGKYLVIVDNFKIGIMSLKQSRRLQQTLLTYQQTWSQQFHGRRASETAFQCSKQDSIEMEGPELSQPCSRCNLKQAQKICGSCKSLYFCQGCDQMIHGFGKFQTHPRHPLTSETRSASCLSVQVSDCPSSSAKNSISGQIKKSTQLAISQAWDTLIGQISQRFRTAIDSMKDKKKQIIQKMERKREQELKCVDTHWEENSYSSPNLQLQVKKDRPEGQVRVLSLNVEEAQQRVERKYRASFGLLDEIQGLVTKIEVRNILVKTVEEVPIQTAKKAMKRSLFLSPCTSSAVSPGTKTPVHVKQLSQSTIEMDPLQLVHKMSQQSKKKVFETEKDSKLLAKVRSEKLFCKSPTNSNVTKYFKDKEKGTQKKGI